MKLYIEAFYEDGRPKLGNMDGQGVINGSDWRHSGQWRERVNESTFAGGFKTPYVAYWAVVDKNDRELTRTPNAHYIPREERPWLKESATMTTTTSQPTRS